MELKETIPMMDNADYKERFKAEYHQLDIRLRKLIAMVDEWKNGKLEFKPSCPIETYELQIEYMEKYRAILVMRAKIEGVEL